MKLVKPKVEVWKQEVGIDGMYRHIERVARVCYKSGYDPNADIDTCKFFVEQLVKNNHGAMLEHGTVYKQIDKHVLDLPADIYWKHNYLIHNHYTNTVNIDRGDRSIYYITTNFRVLKELDIPPTMFMVDYDIPFIRKITMHFTCSRAIAQELTRHRVFSFAMESQRYCNYGKDKFNNEVTFIAPLWYTDTTDRDGDNYLRDSLEASEKTYFNLLSKGYSPQYAREVLPNATKTELVMTGTDKQWFDFFKLRWDGVSGAPHPEMKRICELAISALEYAGLYSSVFHYDGKYKQTL